jgi:type II secretory pathway pseudopilin PulG
MEIMLVLAIIAMLTALGAGLLFNMDTDANKPSDLLIRMARQASRASVVQGHPISISFTKTGFGLNGSTGGSDTTTCTLSKDSKIDFQRWNGGSRWQPSIGLVWTFYPTGIADALHFRIYDEGLQTELKFNPLTGSPRNQ